MAARNRTHPPVRSGSAVRRPRTLLAAAAAIALLPQLALAALPAPARAAPGGSPETGSYLLTATSPGGNYAPTFTGNGYIGIRVPPAGQGYAAKPVPVNPTLAGFYAKAPGQVQQRADLPAWSALTFSDGGKSFSLSAGRVTGWRQQLDLHDGTITTTATWRAPDGHVTDVRYEIFTNRARQHAAVVRLDLTPRWSGTATVTDLMIGAPATLTRGVAAGWDTAAHQDWQAVKTLGTGLIAGLASRVVLGPGARQLTDTRVGGPAQTVGQRLRFARDRWSSRPT